MSKVSQPSFLYHGSSRLIEGPLHPVLEHKTLNHVHDRPAVFATARMDIASLFMFPLDTLASIGFEEDIAYICIWGTPEDFAIKDHGGFLYILPPESFEKVGKEYEWQSFSDVQPVEVKKFESVIDGMIQCGVHVYFINDDDIFDQIRDNKNHRTPILKNLNPYRP